MKKSIMLKDARNKSFYFAKGCATSQAVRELLPWWLLSNIWLFLAKEQSHFSSVRTDLVNHLTSKNWDHLKEGARIQLLNRREVIYYQIKNNGFDFLCGYYILGLLLDKGLNETTCRNHLSLTIKVSGPEGYTLRPKTDISSAVRQKNLEMWLNLSEFN